MPFFLSTIYFSIKTCQPAIFCCYYQHNQIQLNIKYWVSKCLISKLTDSMAKNIRHKSDVIKGDKRW